MRKFAYLIIFSAALLAAGATATWAVEAADTLPDRIIEPEPEGPVLDTALVFTNIGASVAEAKFEAYDDAGDVVSSGNIEIPARGLVYVLASRLANAAGLEGFVGHVRAKATGHVIGSTVVLGGVLTDIDTLNHTRRVRRTAVTDAEFPDAQLISRITFPVVATR